MVIEFARNVLKYEDANSTEFDPESNYPVINFIPGQEDLKETGASMRLGNYPCIISEGSKVSELYSTPEIIERHRHRYEVNNDFKDQFKTNGLIDSGISPDAKLVEIMEVEGHPFMIGSQFHPEFLSRPDQSHPLFNGFISASINTIIKGDQIRLIN